MTTAVLTVSEILDSEFGYRDSHETLAERLVDQYRWAGENYHHYGYEHDGAKHFQWYMLTETLGTYYSYDYMTAARIFDTIKDAEDAL